MELLLVLGIIGVIASVVIIAINPRKQLTDAENGKRKTMIRSQEAAALQYGVDKSQVPAQGIPNGEASAKAVCRPGVTDPSCINISSLVPTYITAIPVDSQETGIIATGYRIFTGQAQRILFCNDYLSAGDAKRCSGSTAVANFECPGPNVAPYAGGAGTVANPYQLCSCTQLQGMTQFSNYVITHDIDCSATAGWNAGQGYVPLMYFSGILDGQNYTVSGLTINRPGVRMNGLFFNMQGTTRNLKLRNISYVGGEYTGGLAGLLNGTTTNVSVTGTITASDSSGDIGGLSGGGYGGTVSKCWSNVTIVSNIGGNSGGVGGLLGSVRGTMNVSDSYALGSVRGDGSAKTGGFAGTVENTARISNSYSVGAVTGTTPWKYGFGGFITGTTSTANFYDSTINYGGMQDGIGGIPSAQATSTALMKQQGTFTGWDFSSIWQMLDPGNAYPTLR